MRLSVKLLSLSCLLAALVGGPSAPSAQATTSTKTLTILVVAGQSNAVGYQSYVVDPKTHVDVFTGPSSSPADKHVLLMWTESGVPSSGPTPVPLDTLQKLEGAPSAIFGPEVGLARRLYADGDHELLIVKVAYSGTSLAIDWQPKQPDFLALVSRVDQATQWAKAHGFDPVIGGFYWMQGETDAMQASTAAAYAGNLKSFLSNVRAELPLRSTTPIVVGQIDIADYIEFLKTVHKCMTPSCSGETRWNAEVMAAQADASGKYVYVASTATYPRYEDFLHLSNAGELDLGKRFANLSAKHLG